MRHAKWIVAILVIAGILLSASSLFAQDPYKVFNQYRAAAKAGKPYPGAPLKGKLIGFANIYGTLPFCIDVENSIKQQLKLAGGDLNKGWISMDNQYDAVIGLKNADIMLAKKPHFFIEFQADAKANYVIAAKFGAAKIPMIAIDVAVPGAPFMGTNNYQAAIMAGHYMAKLIRQKWGGWDGVDMVALAQMPAGGTEVMLRSEGIADARCVDPVRLSDVAGRPIRASARAHRQGCGCFQSRDIGEYDTCPHGCVYCYAVRSRPLARERYRAHDPQSEFLFSGASA